jgi:hypothetical protein
MGKISFVFACFGIGLGLAAATPAQALNQRSFVSGSGTGTACTITAPCLTFQIAHDATSPFGVVTCLDSGANSSTGIFFVNITKSITIDCGGTSATSWYVTVNGPGIVVTLRNLQITSVGNTAGVGVNFVNGAALFVDHCVIENWNGSPGNTAIKFAPAVASGTTAKLEVTDSVIKNSGVAAFGTGGIVVAPTGGGIARAVIERTQVNNNSYGIVVDGTGGGLTVVEIRDSVVADNAYSGIYAHTTGGITSVIVDHSASLHNLGVGALAEGSGAFVSLTGSTIGFNATGIYFLSGGAVYSYGNNTVNGNQSPGLAPTATSLQ